MNIFIDIETIPAGEKPTLDELSPPAQMSKPETIQKWWDDTEAREADLDKIYRKRALSYYQGEILCIAYACDDEEIHGISGNTEEETIRAFEKELMDRWDMGKKFSQGTTPTWIGYNAYSFDFPYLFLRAAKYGCRQLMGMLDTPDDRNFLRDVMKMFCKTDFKGMVSMDNACRFFGIPTSKDKMSGDKVYDEYLAGHIEDIMKYCCEDVRCVRELYHKLT